MAGKLSETIDLIELKNKMHHLNQQIEALEKERGELEALYAKEACPWPKDTILRHRQTGQLLVVVADPRYYRDGWGVGCYKIKKDFTFAVYGGGILERDAKYWQVVNKEFALTDTGIAPHHKIRGGAK